MSPVRGIVLQNSVFANGQNFPEALVRSFKNDVGGSHDQSTFQPAALASSLRGIGLPNTGFDEHGLTAKIAQTSGRTGDAGIPITEM
jgi:hypothetical protein